MCSNTAGAVLLPPGGGRSGFIGGAGVLFVIHQEDGGRAATCEGLHGPGGMVAKGDGKHDHDAFLPLLLVLDSGEMVGRSDLRGGEGPALPEQMRSEGRRALFEVPFAQRQKGTSCAAEQMRRLVQSSRNAGACSRHLRRCASIRRPHSQRL